MTKSNYSLRLQPSLKMAAEKFAAIKGTTAGGKRSDWVRGIVIASLRSQ